MAEGYLKAKALPDIKVKSRGLCAGGEPVSENSRLAMKEINIDISEHFSKPVTAADIAWADRIICMAKNSPF